MTLFDNANVFNPADGTWELSAFTVEDGKIALIGPAGSLTGEKTDLKGKRVIPGLIDCHVHIESSLLIPREFGRLILSHGVTAAVCDPHEIANVAGTAGIDFMLEDAKASPADLYFMVPSCVPATPLEVGGAAVTAEDLKKYVGHPRVLGLGEMMNVPGVLNKDPEVLAKLSLFRHIDGHAPQVTGEALCGYCSYGISTDHECTTAAEAKEKVKRGMYILLREGDAAKNVAALTPAVSSETAARFAFATDDRHADSLAAEGSIDNCIREAQKAGMPLDTALRLATLSAADIMGFSDRGLLAPGRLADFCILADGEEFRVTEVYKNGVKFVSERAAEHRPDVAFPPFKIPHLTEKDLELPDGNLKTVSVIPGELITECVCRTKDAEGVNKVVCIDRYRGVRFGVAPVLGFGLTKGAVASSIGHDAHNIIAVGASDSDLLRVISAVSDAEGGMAVCIDGNVSLLPLPIGGLMTAEAYETVSEKLQKLDSAAEATGAKFRHVFMPLSFLGLTVIPHLKITPRGLFDGDTFSDTDLTWS